MKKRLFLITSVVLSMIFIFSGCKKAQTPQTPAKAEETAVLWVNSEPVYEEEYKFYLETMKIMVANNIDASPDEIDWSTAEFSGKKALEMIKQSACDDIARKKTAAAEAKARSLTVTEEEKNAVLTQFMTEYFNTDSKDEILEKCGISAETLAIVTEDVAYSRKLQEALLSEGNMEDITEDELRGKYDAKLAELASSGEAATLGRFDDEAVRDLLKKEIVAERVNAVIDSLADSAEVKINNEKLSEIN